LEHAVQLYGAVIAANPRDAEAHYKRGNAHNGLGRAEAALADYDRTIALDPGHAHAFCNRGTVLERLNRGEEALASYDRALTLDPEDALTYGNRGSLLRKLGRLAEALANYDRAIELKADYVEAYFYRGHVLNGLKRYEAAVASYDQAIERTSTGLNPHLAYSSRAFALAGLGRLDEALASYDRAIALNGDSVEAHVNRGSLLLQLGRHEAAVTSYDRAIELAPVHAEAFQGRGLALRHLRRFDEALACFEQAVQLKGDFAEAYLNRGHILLEVGRNEAAVASYERAIELDAACIDAFQARAFALQNLGRLEAAIQSYERALAINPDQKYLLGLRRHAQMQICDWHGLEEDVARLTRELAAGRPVSTPFPLLALVDSAPLHRLAAEMWVREECGPDDSLGAIPARGRGAAGTRPADTGAADTDAADTGAADIRAPDIRAPDIRAADIRAPDIRAPDIRAADIRAPDIRAADTRGERIRIGYFSPDFRNHPVSRLSAELFETHDRSRFEITAFAFGPDAHDDVHARLVRAFDRFVDLRDRSDLDSAKLARSLGIDIAVDLGGFTEYCRTRIFALRAAPVQVSYLGYLGTMGAPYMDYLVADETIIRPSERANYAEKIIYLPSYQVNDSTRRIAERTFTREELGLPAAGFVFASFNANYKITPGTFAAWMGILARVEGSVLFLYAGHSGAKRNLSRAAELSGIDPRRIVFGAHLKFEEYLARFQTMHLFLDTLPYNAGTTASDALWAGLPVLTCVGQAFAGRVAASLLTAIDLPELITATAGEYEDRAVELATNPDLLDVIRRKLARNRAPAPLFDTPRFTRTLESAFAQIHARRLAALPPADVYCSP
jgi:predicted O-linked N-acetylglucosamine transferase (SPINDLY family)